MCRKIRTAVVVLSALVLTAMAFTELTAQDHYVGGAVKGIQVNTSPWLASTSINSTPTRPGPFEPLASSELTVHVNAGESDLFVYEFDAQCHVSGGGDEDVIHLQARVNNSLRGVPDGPAILQPQNTLLILGPGSLLAPTFAAKSWAARLAGGSEGADYTLTIWWRAFDRLPLNPGLTASCANRIVKLTRYN